MLRRQGHLTHVGRGEFFERDDLVGVDTLDLIRTRIFVTNHKKPFYKTLVEHSF